jgi:hypothetical protein
MHELQIARSVRHETKVCQEIDIKHISREKNRKRILRISQRIVNRVDHGAVDFSTLKITTGSVDTEEMTGVEFREPLRKIVMIKLSKN